MRLFLLALALLLPRQSCAQDQAAAKALAKVQAEEAQMLRAQDAAAAAEQKKGRAAQKAIEAQQRLNDLPDWRIISKGIAEMKANGAKEAFLGARVEADTANSQFVSEGKNYIDAENAYHGLTGSYYNEQEYASVKDKIHLSAAAPAQGDAPATPEAAAQESQNLQKMLSSGKPMSLGELAQRGQNLSHMGDDMIAQALSANNAAPGAGRPGGGGPAAAPPAAMEPAGAPGGSFAAGRPAAAGALNVDKAILLSRPVGDNRKAATGRFVSAGAERLSAADHHGALRAAEAAVKEDPRDAKAWWLKAAALNKLRRFGDAELAAKRAVELDRSDPLAYRELAWAQLHNGKAEDAEASATQMIILDPENAEGYLLRALAYELKGDRAHMLADLERAAGLDPRFLNHLARAKAGLRLFDPSASDTDNLLNALAPPPGGRGSPLLALGLGMLALAGLGLAARFGPALLAAARKPTVPAPKAASNAPAPAARLRPPEADESLLAGKYRLQRVAGRGGMGQVWQALDESLQRPVAVKEMSPELAKDPALRAIYLKEARTLATLHHPNIVEIYEILDLPPRLFLALEWVAGKTLHQVLAEKHRLPLEAARAVLIPVCEALAYAHEHGVVHRDLKPANIMVTGEGRVKLMDFGIARELGAAVPAAETAAAAPAQGDALTGARTRTVAGTPAYRPPDAEQGVVTPAFDIFCLGVCFYEMLTGEMPFGRQGWAPKRSDYARASVKVPGLPEAVDDILERALELDHSKRLADAKTFRRALAQL